MVQSMHWQGCHSSGSRSSVKVKPPDMQETTQAFKVNPSSNYLHHQRKLVYRGHSWSYVTWLFRRSFLWIQGHSWCFVTSFAILTSMNHAWVYGSMGQLGQRSRSGILLYEYSEHLHQDGWNRLLKINRFLRHTPTLEGKEWPMRRRECSELMQAFQIHTEGKPWRACLAWNVDL